MQASNIPTKFPIIFASSAAGGTIRTVPNTTSTPGAASFTNGFPELNFEPEGSGGIPPFGQDFNGLLKVYSAWLQWQQAGGPIPYDATFQSAVGGYPKGALVQSAVTFGVFWLCLVDNNATNPDTGGSGWENISPDRAAGGGLTGFYPNPQVVPGAGLYTGQVFWFTGRTAPAGSLAASGQRVSRTTFANLFAVAAPLGTVLLPYGPGDGSTTFNMPNINNANNGADGNNKGAIFIRGIDLVGNVDPGAIFGSLELDQLQGFTVGPSTGESTTGATSTGASDFLERTSTGHGGALSIGGGAGGWDIWPNTGGPVTDGTNGTPRVGIETRGRAMPLLACVKT